MRRKKGTDKVSRGGKNDRTSQDNTENRDFWNLSKGIFSVALVTNHLLPSVKANPQTTRSNVSVMGKRCEMRGKGV